MVGWRFRWSRWLRNVFALSASQCGVSVELLYNELLYNECFAWYAVALPLAAGQVSIS